MRGLVTLQKIATEKTNAEQKRGQRRCTLQKSQPAEGIAPQTLRHRARGHGIQRLIQAHARGSQQIG